MTISVFAECYKDCQEKSAMLIHFVIPAQGLVEKPHLSDTIHEIVIASVATRSPTSGIMAIFGDYFVALRLLAMTLLNFLTFSTTPQAGI
jgi:hypothetical protein